VTKNTHHSFGHSLFTHFDKRPRVYAFALLAFYLFVNTTINATSAWMEGSRDGQIPEFALWEPFSWEYTSLFSTLLLVPIMVWWFKRVPFSISRFGRFVLLNLIATVIYSALHVGIMVALREWIYWMAGGNYNFGNALIEFFYEYRKDAWGFIFFMAMYYAYRFIYTRLKGEASLIDESSNGGEQRDQAKLRQDEALNQAPKRVPEHLLVKKLDKEFLVKVDDIEWLEASGNYVNLHIGERIFPLRSTLSGLLPKISEKGFAQTHRSYGVNLHKIESISSLPSGDGEIHLHGGHVLALSRRYKDDFKSRVS
jgi:hypothetical protein